MNENLFLRNNYSSMYQDKQTTKKPKPYRDPYKKWDKILQIHRMIKLFKG